MKITMINIFLGGLPKWIERFADRVNPLKDYQWILIHFCGKSISRGNFRMLKVSYQSLDEITRSRLGVCIDWTSLKDRRKVGELRPTFGVLFQDLIQDSNWWGYYDLDVVFGRVDRFFTEDLLENFDTASTTSIERWSGPFQLVKNLDVTNNLFRQHPDWKGIISSPRYHIFDENVIGAMSLSAGLRSLHIPQWQSHDYMKGHPNLKIVDGNLHDNLRNKPICMFHFPRTKKWPKLT